MRQFQAGKITMRDVEHLRLTMQDTTQFPEHSLLRSRIRRLSLDKALQVWDAANDKERQAIAPLIFNKQAQWHKTQAKNATPAEREEMGRRLAIFAGQNVELQRKMTRTQKLSGANRGTRELPAGEEAPHVAAGYEDFHPDSFHFSPTAWAKANPDGNVMRAVKMARQLGYKVAPGEHKIYSA